MAQKRDSGNGSGIESRQNSGESRGDKSGIKPSLKDSQGKTLTEVQAKFFADSKVRDEQGNLLVVYHYNKKSNTFLLRLMIIPSLYVRNDKKYERCLYLYNTQFNQKCQRL